MAARVAEWDAGCAAEMRIGRQACELCGRRFLCGPDSLTCGWCVVEGEELFTRPSDMDIKDEMQIEDSTSPSE